MIGTGCAPTVTYRYRLTIEVETPQGLRSGSSVIETTIRDTTGAVLSTPEARTISSKVRGEAVFVDLGEGRNVVAILALSGASDLAKAFRYLLARWAALTRVFEDGRLALDNNAAERALRGVAVGRKNYLFAGSQRGAERAAAFYTLIETAKLNGLDPEAYLRDVLARINDHPQKRLAELLPWNWTPLKTVAQAA